VAKLRWERSALGFVLELNAAAQNRVVTQVANLRAFPLLGAPAMGRYAEKRRLVVGPYSIVYEFDEHTDTVSVVAVSRGGPLFR